MSNTPTISRVVEYEFRLTDNVAQQAYVAVAASEKMKGAVDNTTEAVNRQNISYIKTVASLGAFRHGLRSMQMGMEDLGLISKKTNQNFYNLISAVDLFVGSALAIKGVIGIMKMLGNAEVGVAVVETYRKTLANPAYAAVAIGAGIAAGAVGGYLYAQSTKQEQEVYRPTVTYNQTVNFPMGSEKYNNSRAAARSSMEGAGF